MFAATGAAGVALALGLGAMPASAVASPGVPSSDAPSDAALSPKAGGSGTGLNEAGLNEAGLRDLGLTPEEFATAAELGRQAADAETAVAEEHARTPDGSELALTTEQLFEAYLRDVGPEGLQAVVTTGAKFVIRTGLTNSPQSGPDTTPTFAAAPTEAGRMSPSEFVSKYANVSLDNGGSLSPEADLPGGLGYRADNWVCSTGFSAFDPAGLPAVLTAGHCAADGTVTAAILEFQGTPAGLLGQFGFSQFGGPGNSPILRPDNLEDPGNVGTDVAVIGDVRADLDPLPAASTWGDERGPGPDVKIIGTAAPVIGMPVCRSGRSSGWSCGTIDEVGIFVVGGQNYGADPTDLRAFTGFLSFDVQSGGGDSGGPWVSGNYAVGTHSAGDTPDQNGQVIQNFAVAATLQDSWKVLPGYQLELFLNKPQVGSPAPGETFSAGQAITGEVAAAPASAVAAGSTVRITLAGQAPFDVPLDAHGTWSFTAPATAGRLRFTAETVNGFSTSGPAGFDLAPAAAQPPPVTEPTVTPAPDPTVTPAAEPTIPASAAPPQAPQNPAPADVPAAKGNVSPAGDIVVVARPTGANLANTGASGLLVAAGLAGLALVVGGVLLAFARRRTKQRHHPLIYHFWVLCHPFRNQI